MKRLFRSRAHAAVVIMIEVPVLSLAWGAGIKDGVTGFFGMFGFAQLLVLLPIAASYILFD